MAKLTTVTRQLAERRARLAAEVPRLEKLSVDIAEQLAKARAELAAVDLILPTFDARVVPELIAPVKAQGVRYGKRGTFKEALLQVLWAAGANAMSTAELSMRLRHHFELEFATPEALKNWTDNVLRKQLRRSAREGVVERLKVGEIRWEGKAYESMSQLARAMRGDTSNNAWKVLEVKRPGDANWKLADHLRG